METGTIDKLFLELSQFTQAKTERELHLERWIREIANSTSHDSTSAVAEYALADIENREPEEWAEASLNNPPPPFV